MAINMGLGAKLASATSKLVDYVLPTKSFRAGGIAVTDTYKAGRAEVISAPTYRDHLTDLFDSRQQNNSKILLKELFRTDPDCSAAVNAYLTTSNTPLKYYVYDANGELSQEGTQLLFSIIDKITHREDYTLNYQMKRSINGIREELKYMLLLRGSIGVELVFDKMMQPSELRNIDMGSVNWFEKKPGEYKPQQETAESSEKISLDIPTFFTASFRRDPTSPYTYSYFVSSINTIAARQQVINDLYRIMQVNGYPRIEIKVLEDIVLKNAPASIKNNPDELRSYVSSIVQNVANSFNGIRPDQPFAHTDAIETGVINEKAAGVALQISEVVDTLNAQNQAALKAVSSFLGRGGQGVNTATVEAQIFAMNAEALNEPIDYILSEAFTMALRVMGFDGKVEIVSRPPTLKPAIELEAQITMQHSRLKEALSIGLITDEQYYIEIDGHIPLGNYPKLSGTQFDSTKVNTADVSPNSDPLGRAITPDGNKSARSNTVTTTTDREKGKNQNTK